MDTIRLFDSGKTAYGGGNNVTFFSGILQEIMPDFVTYIKELVTAEQNMQDGDLILVI